MNTDEFNTSAIKRGINTLYSLFQHLFNLVFWCNIKNPSDRNITFVFCVFVNAADIYGIPWYQSSLRYILY